MIGTLYGGPLTLPAAVVRVVLAENALPFKFVEIPWSPQEGYTPVHPMVAKYHPEQRNPVWVDDDVALYDSFLICSYLEDRYRLAAGQGQNAAQRAGSRSLLFDANRYLFPIIDGLVRDQVYGSGISKADAHPVEDAITAFVLRTKKALELGQYQLNAVNPSTGDLATATLLSGCAFLNSGLPHACEELTPWLRSLQERPSLQSVFGEMEARVSQLMPTSPPSYH